ncbi:hypothetical protein BDY19DRAFT_990791 [Irpex rosettiformis]|uniref:Uncharacterized protein n=1 Tax=Irpex rosettiformis TaxID=378272 RepID=A0ACB8UCI3_9APHY|nr:hypothetical protein BDY19DRAFT_990791 [Irpex rosettiformis]
MPTLPVNTDGAVLYYEDSGVPDNANDYTTIIIFHGFIFHGASFRLLFRYASLHNLRIVAVNHREYPGSSPLSEREIANVWSPEPNQQTTALREQAMELAVFIARFIELEDIPPPVTVDGKKTGGVGCLAWSQGCGPFLSLLANISRMDIHVSTLLERYMRTVFLYDPPCIVLGIPFPPGVTTPIHDPDLLDEEKPQKFIDWISSYFNPLSTPESITDEALRRRYNMYEKTGDERYRAVSLRLKKAELNSIVSPEIFPRIGVMLAYAREVYDDALQNALFDTKGQWNHLRTVAICPDMTIWTCNLSHRVLSDMLANSPTVGKVRRTVEMVTLRNANHTYHFTEPEKFIHLLTSYM